jgi:hypothetical protein
MKFKGTPNLLVRITKPRRGEVKHFSFDENGIYETENPFTIMRLRAQYEEVKEEINLEKSVKVAVQGEKIKHCKKCDFTCKTQGELLKHHKTEHPKGES